MNHIKLYSILFEADDTTSILDPKAMASDIATSVGDILKEPFEKLGDRFEKQSKEVSTNSLSTSGAKPATGSRESTTNEKIDQIKQGINDLQTSNAESAETIINTLKDTLKDKK